MERRDIYCSRLIANKNNSINFYSYDHYYYDMTPWAPELFNENIHAERAVYGAPVCVSFMVSLWISL